MNEEESKNTPPQAQTRQLIIITDGMTFRIAPETSCSMLEVKEICRELLVKLGG